MALAFSKNERYLAVADVFGDVGLFDIDRHSRIQLGLGPQSPASPINDFEGVDGEHALAFSPDSKRIAMYEKDGNVWISDVERHELLSIWRAGTGDAKIIDYSPDGKWLLTSTDGEITICDVTHGTCDISLISFGHGGWLAVDRMGRFDASDMDGIPAAWVIKDQPLQPAPVEIFMRDFFTPGLSRNI